MSPKNSEEDKAENHGKFKEELQNPERRRSKIDTEVISYD
jgi:hypothetical protein